MTFVNVMVIFISVFLIKTILIKIAIPTFFFEQFVHII